MKISFCYFFRQSMKELDRLSAEEAALRRENRALERNNGLLKHDLKEVILFFLFLVVFLRF